MDYGDHLKFLSKEEGYLKDVFIEYRNIYYYFNEEGFMEPVVVKIDGELVLIDGEDNEGISKWIYIDGSWRYSENGIVVTGWQEIEDEEEEEEEGEEEVKDPKKAKTEEKKERNKNWYYFDEEGRMIQDGHSPDGYIVDEEGKYTGELYQENPAESFTDHYEEGEPMDFTLGISGKRIGEMPAELFMLMIAGETMGLKDLSPMIGDGGRAYGVGQFDYRYELTSFMNYAYKNNPDLWSGFEYLRYFPKGLKLFVNNDEIKQTFVWAMENHPKEAIRDQLSFIRIRYWDSCYNALKEAGIDLDQRHIAVSAAMLSVNVNCGNSKEYFIKYLEPEMTDEGMIEKIYWIRNNVLSQIKVGGVTKGTNNRFKEAEPEMAMDMLNGKLTIDDDKTYGGIVRWCGSTFTKYLSENNSQ